MQIFFLALDPKKCAQYLCDKHCVKMPTETAQILSTVWWNTNDALASNYHNQYGLYLAFPNRRHPVIRWASLSIANYLWVIKLLKELCMEFEYRYGHPHACSRLVPLFEDVFGLPPLPNQSWIPMSSEFQAVPDEHKDDDPVVAYKTYYFLNKRRFAEWKKTRKAPAWWSDLLPRVLEVIKKYH